MASLLKSGGTDQGYKFSNGAPLSPGAIDSSVSELFSNPWQTIPSKTPAIENIIDENERLRGEVETLKLALERKNEKLAAQDKKIYELEKLVPWRDFKITMLEEFLEVVKANRDCYKEKFEEAEQKLEKVEPLVEVGKATRWRNWEDKLSKFRWADIDVPPEEDYDVFDRIGLGEAGNHAAHWINLRADLALFDTIINSRIKEIRAQEFEWINHISIDLARRSVEIFPKGLMEAKSMRIEVDFLTHMDDEFRTPYQDAFKNNSEEHEALFKSLLEMNKTRSRSEFDACLEVKHNLYQMRRITENILRTRKKIRRNASRGPVTVR